MSPQETKQLNGPLYRMSLDYAKTLTHNRETAKDLVQDAYYRANKRKVTFQSGSNLWGWVRAIVYNTFLSDYRHRKRRETLLRENLNTVGWAVTATVSNPVLESFQVADVKKLINDLPKLYREPFVLFHQ